MTVDEKLDWLHASIGSANCLTPKSAPQPTLQGARLPCCSGSSRAWPASKAAGQAGNGVARWRTWNRALDFLIGAGFAVLDLVASLPETEVIRAIRDEGKRR
jgi:hypothetical protein